MSAAKVKTLTLSSGEVLRFKSNGDFQVMRGESCSARGHYNGEHFSCAHLDRPFDDELIDAVKFLAAPQVAATVLPPPEPAALKVVEIPDAPSPKFPEPQIVRALITQEE